MEVDLSLCNHRPSTRASGIVALASGRLPVSIVVSYCGLLCKCINNWMSWWCSHRPRHMGCSHRELQISRCPRLPKMIEFSATQRTLLPDASANGGASRVLQRLTLRFAAKASQTSVRNGLLPRQIFDEKPEIRRSSSGGALMQVARRHPSRSEQEGCTCVRGFGRVESL